jgi:hypothetical protein
LNIIKAKNARITELEKQLEEWNVRAEAAEIIDEGEAEEDAQEVLFDEDE